jgi:hypothetical protein
LDLFSGRFKRFNKPVDNPRYSRIFRIQMAGNPTKPLPLYDRQRLAGVDEFQKSISMPPSVWIHEDR